MRRLSLLLAAVLVAGACSGDDSASPDDGSAPATETTAPSTEAAAAFELTSAAFAEGGPIPEVNAGCAIGGGPGDNVAPALSWSGVPDGADQLAVTMVDPDAGGFVHWVIAGIDPASSGLEEGTVPDGAVEALNDAGQAGYFGPCPPEAHTYVFTVHALSEDPGIAPGAVGADALAAVEGVSAAGAELSGEFDPAGP